MAAPAAGCSKNGATGRPRSRGRPVAPRTLRRVAGLRAPSGAGYRLEAASVPGHPRGDGRVLDTTCRPATVGAPGRPSSCGRCPTSPDNPPRNDGRSLRPPGGRGRSGAASDRLAAGGGSLCWSWRWRSAWRRFGERCSLTRRRGSPMRPLRLVPLHVVEAPQVDAGPSVGELGHEVHVAVTEEASHRELGEHQPGHQLGDDHSQQRLDGHQGVGRQGRAWRRRGSPRRRALR